MEEFKVNGVTTVKEGTWFEISNSLDGVISYGNCEESMSAEDVYRAECRNTFNFIQDLTLRFLNNPEDVEAHNRAKLLLEKFKQLGEDYTTY